MGKKSGGCGGFAAATTTPHNIVIVISTNGRNLKKNECFCKKMFVLFLTDFILSFH